MTVCSAAFQSSSYPVSYHRHIQAQDVWFLLQFHFSKGKVILQNSWALKILANATQTTANVKSCWRLFSAEEMTGWSDKVFWCSNYDGRRGGSQTVTPEAVVHFPCCSSRRCLFFFLFIFFLSTTTAQPQTCIYYFNHDDEAFFSALLNPNHHPSLHLPFVTDTSDQ